MTWDMWCDLICCLKAFKNSNGYILEQLLCEGKLPLVCERCNHRLSHHQFDIRDGQATRTFCNNYSCFDSGEHSLCPEYVGMYVEPLI